MKKINLNLLLLLLLTCSIISCDDDFLNDQTNSFQRIFHERKPGYINLKINGWFTKSQIINNYKMLLQELDEWKTSENGIRWKHKSD